MNDDLEDAVDLGAYLSDHRRVQMEAAQAAFTKPLPKARDPKAKFWMLFVEGQSSPTHKHEDYMTATLEAKRIMDQPNFKGARVYILEATGLVEAKVTKEFTHTEIKYE